MMMESENNRDNQNSGGGGGDSNSRGKALSRPPEALNCPRCDSPNTKFCYFNNYSLTQPRHFCKTCRRYWTKGGALRNVPVGGGCRKNKKISKSSSSRLSVDSKDSSGASSYSDLGGFKFFNAISPAHEYPLGGGLTNFSRLNTISATPGLNNNQFFSSFGEISSGSGFGLDPNSGNNLNQFMAFNNFPLSSSSSLVKQDQGDVGFNGVLLQDMGTNGNLASPIESLSSINQDLHWKLQQQRFNSILNGADINNQQNEMISNTPNLENQDRIQKPQPILFQNLEISSKPEGSRKDNNGITAANLATEWYFGNSSSYAPANHNSTNNGNDNGNGIQAWGNFDQYTTLR